MPTGLFDPNGREVCPADGNRPLREFEAGLPKWFKMVASIEVREVVSKVVPGDEGGEEVQGVVAMTVYYRVDSGEAPVTVYQVAHCRGERIVYMNSFWDPDVFRRHARDHPELRSLYPSLFE